MLITLLCLSSPEQPSSTTFGSDGTPRRDPPHPAVLQRLKGEVNLSLKGWRRSAHSPRHPLADCAGVPRRRGELIAAPRPKLTRPPPPSMVCLADRGRDHTPLVHSNLNPNQDDERGESRGRGFNASGRGEFVWPVPLPTRAAAFLIISNAKPIQSPAPTRLSILLPPSLPRT